CMEGLEFPLTF
nr:immunoglobulin light chain junction region [Macaca mulatta]